MSNFLGTNLFMVAVLVFIAMLLLLEAAYLFWRGWRGPEAHRLKQRIQALSVARAASSGVLKQRLMDESPWAERVLEHLPRLRGLNQLILQSNSRWTVSGVLIASLALFAGGVFVSLEMLRTMSITALGVGLACAALPVLRLSWQRRKRLGKIEQQLPEALDMMTRALRAGHAFNAALKMAGEELPEPIAMELRAVHEEMNFGVSFQQALAHLVERVPLTDLRYFTVAVLIQRDSGGNLTEILSNLSRLLRERAKLLARVRVLSAEGRLSAWILSLMPFGMAGLLAVFNPTFISPLWTDPIGIGIVQGLLVMMAVGVLVMRRIVRIRV